MNIVIFCYFYYLLYLQLFISHYYLLRNTSNFNIDTASTNSLFIISFPLSFSFHLLLSHTFRSKLLTILELSEFVAVFAEPKDLRTVKAAARCLKASVSGPPPATSKSCLSNSIEAYVFPEPLVPVEEVPEIFILEKQKKVEFVKSLTRKNNRLRIPGLRLLSYGFLDDLV